MHPQLRKPGQLGLLIGLAHSEDQAYRFRGEAASHELQRPGRRLVQPLRIVHDADQWLLLGRGCSRRVNDSDAGPHPNKAHAAWGRRARRLEPDSETPHIVRWIFARRLAGHSVARIARALNEAGVPCPSVADPGRNPHRTGAGWTLGTVTTILSNPRYTGRQVWNRQRTDRDLADPADVSLGHKRTIRELMPVLSLCDQVDLWRYGRSAGLAVLG